MAIWGNTWGTWLNSIPMVCWILSVDTWVKSRKIGRFVFFFFFFLAGWWRPMSEKKPKVMSRWYFLFLPREGFFLFLELFFVSSWCGTFFRGAKKLGSLIKDGKGVQEGSCRKRRECVDLSESANWPKETKSYLSLPKFNILPVSVFTRLPGPMGWKWKCYCAIMNVFY